MIVKNSAEKRSAGEILERIIKSNYFNLQIDWDLIRHYSVDIKFHCTGINLVNGRGF